eukprot:scaffold5873_cov172-Amphora_coffeaeformis.AAC.4
MRRKARSGKGILTVHSVEWYRYGMVEGFFGSRCHFYSRLDTRDSLPVLEKVLVRLDYLPSECD